MSKQYDVVIVGAGVIGLNIAYQLSRRSALRIAVLEKGRAVGEGSSGASSAICRHLYTHDEMITLARDGINQYREWSSYLEASQPTKAKFEQTGVLWLGSEQHHWSQDSIDRLRHFGIPEEILDDNELNRRFPSINPCRFAPDFETGKSCQCDGADAHLFEPSGGYMDPQYVLEDLLYNAKARGVDIFLNTEVDHVYSTNDKVQGVVSTQGDHYFAGKTILAAGPWTTQLLGQIGLAEQWPLIPTRIQVLYKDRPPELQGHIPVCADLTSGVYFRLQNQQLIIGSTLPEDEEEAVADADDFDRLADQTFKMHKMHALHHRLPGLPYRGKIGSYCGLYTINRTDMHPIVGPTPCANLYIAAGFSGHGFKIAPAIGSLMAQMITGNGVSGDTDVPLSFLSWKRKPLALDVKSVLA